LTAATRTREVGENQRPSWAPGLVLSRAGARPARSKGQNFLIQPAVADRIVAAAELACGDVVIEIGPGLGILSERIAHHPIQSLDLIELDPRLAAALRARFDAAPKVRVLQSDFLKFELGAIARDRAVKVVGNLPFNAAGAILRKLCAHRVMISRMVLMFQREVAERIRARPGERSYGALSAICALYFEVDAHFRVGAGNFYPRPKVDAEVLTMRPLAVAPFEPEEESSVLEVIHAGFSSRRKTIRNALSGALHPGPTILGGALGRAGIDSNSRAERLGVADFVRLARALGELRGN
jgi:16S rRNA (adenine1518-N6/adenine1519-N6)-dimethyltransferase